MCQREQLDTIEKRPLESNCLNPEFRILPLRCLPESQIPWGEWLGRLPGLLGYIPEPLGYITESLRHITESLGTIPE